MSFPILILSTLMLVSFAKDKPREVKELFRSGKPRRISTYQKSLLHGPTKVFYENGNMKSETNYERGIRHGTEKIFFETGIDSKTVEWKKGKKLRETTFYPTGKKKLEEVFEGALIRRIEFHESGDPRLEVFYKKDVTYYESEEVFEKIAKRFSENGTLTSETRYREGKRDGVAKTYYENGKTAEVRSYDKGRLLSRTEYDLKGKVTLSEEYDEDGNRK